MQNTPTNEKTTAVGDLVHNLFKLGAHFGYSRVRRHPSADKFIFGYKNKTAIIDLEKTIISLTKAKDFVRTLGSEGKAVLLVGNKNEARVAVKKAAQLAGLPYSAERWIGGTLTNTKQIKTRLKRLEEIKAAETSGEIMKYTKKERGLISKEKNDLERHFGGIVEMAKMPAALFVIDSTAEAIAIAEANKLNIPVIALSNSDCDIRGIAYPIIGNDGSVGTIAFFANEIAGAYIEGQKNPVTKPAEVKVENKEAE
ncbi:MAG: 30S ribosomal protein S2 [Candidatus Vogelbacteria bacterium RIFOXYD1_FULL_44_32]|uniref:Small ribosomal subunit protein uS2 n=1 Tax=Candidatus Vogelbacteria bacterium RIFOXYD1_FULL_44_32 TaxID=1802438 RepID=A0A1G2QE66_9BACT|nr:MAG: 30S ribosomal protein S2 [Candidatus Vogelbacteria bacterium RIFOXYD1_FULL_44_32]